jgi:hypothetical protein
MGEDYRFEDFTCINKKNQTSIFKKYLYIGQKLYGIGEGST